MASNHVIKIEPAMAVMTPYVLADFSHHMFNMCASYESERMGFLPRSYLYCVSIELGLKAAILALDCNDTSKKLSKRLGHDLLIVYESFISHYNVQIFDESDLMILGKINPHFHRKGLEYFSPQVMLSMMKAYSDFPKIEDLGSVANKLNKFLIENEFFIDGKTSTKASKGIIVFI